ncbi:MAG: hypothetical protein RIR97_1591 [Pseudomonadota bacterium]|jgi:glutathione S-transferase
MKLYDGGRAPNPRRVSIFLAEKGLDVPRVAVDMAAMEHKSEAIMTRNPMARLPILELDDGTCISESVAICRYFEELHPEPPLFGTGATERAIIEMWNRRVEFHYLLPVGQAFRHIHPAMKTWEIPQLPEWGEINKPKALDFLSFMDGELKGRPFVAGDTFSIADITMMVAFDFMKPARITCPDEWTHVWRWYRNVAARPASKA